MSHAGAKRVGSQLSAIATAACVAYVLGGQLLGETYPFSRFSMYAASQNRTEGAVPAFWVDGELVEPEHYERFSGIDVEAIRPIDVPCTLEYRLYDARRWIGSHQAAPGTAAGPVRFSAGFLILRQELDGSVSRQRRVLTEGHAWPR